MRQQQTVADAIQAAAIARANVEPFDFARGATPLLDVSVPVTRKRHAQGLEERRDRSVGAVAECQPNGELRGFRDIDLSGYCNVAVLGPLKLPVEFPVILQILPGVGGADIAA